MVNFFASKNLNHGLSKKKDFLATNLHQLTRIECLSLGDAQN